MIEVLGSFIFLGVRRLSTNTVTSRNESEFSKMKKVIMSCVAGSALEWYDFAVYGFFATIIGKLFFPSGDDFQEIINKSELICVFCGKK